MERMVASLNTQETNMQSFKNYIDEDKVDNNTIVCARKDANRFEVTKCGKNCSFLTPGQTLTVDHCKELSGKGWNVRYADTAFKKQEGPKSSGEAGKPQKD
jgi:hypothetical protein